MRRSSRDSVRVEDEAKYPEDQQRFDKDDRKQQWKDTQTSTKSAPADLVAKLKDDFDHTDYTRGSPAERLEHMNKDINAIVAEREKVEKERLDREEAGWWQAERAGKHGGVTVDSQTNKVTYTHGGQEGGQSISESRESGVGRFDRTDHGGWGNLPSIMPQGSASSQHRGRDGMDDGMVRDNLRLNKGGSRGLTDDVGSSDGVMGDNFRSSKRTIIPGESDNVGSHSPHPKGIALTLGQDNMNVPSFESEVLALDRTKEARQKVWAGYQPLKDDPDNHPALDPDNKALHMSVTDTLPHGSVTRNRKSTSSAFTAAAASMEADDQTRTHTREGHNRILELGKDDALLSQKDFERNVDMGKRGGGDMMDRTASKDIASSYSRGGSEQHDFLESAGGFFQGGSTLGPAPTTSANAKTWTEGQMKNRLVLPTYLPPDNRMKEKSMLGGAREKMHDAKEKVEDSLDSAKDKIEDTFDSAKDKIEDSYDAAKEKIEDTFESAKERVIGWKDDVKEKLHDAKHTIVDKTDEFTTILKDKTEDAGEKLKEKGRELKDEVREVGDKAKMKGRELKEDLSWKADYAQAHAKVKAKELQRDVKHDAREVKDEAKGLVDKVKDSWWNPWNHMGGGKPIKERQLIVDSSPEGVHLKPAGEGVVLDRDHSVSSGKSSLSTVDADVSPIHVPLSLRGLEDSTAMPKMQTPSIKLKERDSTAPINPMYVPTSIRGLEDVTTPPPMKAPSLKLKGSPSSIEAQRMTAPTSIRGLEDTQPLPKMKKMDDLPLPSVEQSDIGLNEKSELRPKMPAERHGLMWNITHMFDRDAKDVAREVPARSSRSPSPSPRSSSPMTREEKLNVSARDFWDLKGLDSPAPARSMSPSPVSPAQTLSSTLKDGRSPSPQLGMSPVGRGTYATRDILHDETFKELMAQQWE